MMAGQVLVPHAHLEEIEIVSVDRFRPYPLLSEREKTETEKFEMGASARQSENETFVRVFFTIFS